MTSGGVHNAVAVYDEARIHERSKAIAYGIDARAQRFPDEPRYVYQPFAGQEDELPLDPRGARPRSRTTTSSTSASERPDRLRSGRPGVSRQRDQAVARPSAPASVRVSGRSVQICVDAVAVVVTPSTLAADTAPTSRWDTDASSGPARPAHSTRN